MKTTKPKPQVLSVYQFMEQFPTEKSAEQYIADRKWHGNRTCPHCNSDNTAVVRNAKPMPYRCRDCRKHFSVRTGTILAESKIELRKGLFSIYLLTMAGPAA